MVKIRMRDAQYYRSAAEKREIEGNGSELGKYHNFNMGMEIYDKLSNYAIQKNWLRFKKTAEKLAHKFKLNPKNVVEKMREMFSGEEQSGYDEVNGEIYKMYSEQKKIDLLEENEKEVEKEYITEEMKEKASEEMEASVTIAIPISFYDFGEKTDVAELKKEMTEEEFNQVIDKVKAFIDANRPALNKKMPISERTNYLKRANGKYVISRFPSYGTVIIDGYEVVFEEEETGDSSLFLELNLSGEWIVPFKSPDKGEAILNIVKRNLFAFFRGANENTYENPIDIGSGLEFSLDRANAVLFGNRISRKSGNKIILSGTGAQTLAKKLSNIENESKSTVKLHKLRPSAEGAAGDRFNFTSLFERAQALSDVKAALINPEFYKGSGNYNQIKKYYDEFISDCERLHYLKKQLVSENEDDKTNRDVILKKLKGMRAKLQSLISVAANPSSVNSTSTSYDKSAFSPEELRLAKRKGEAAFTSALKKEGYHLLYEMNEFIEKNNILDFVFPSDLEDRLDKTVRQSTIDKTLEKMKDTMKYKKEISSLIEEIKAPDFSIPDFWRKFSSWAEATDEVLGDYADFIETGMRGNFSPEEIIEGRGFIIDSSNSLANYLQALGNNNIEAETLQFSLSSQESSSIAGTKLPKYVYDELENLKTNWKKFKEVFDRYRQKGNNPTLGETTIIADLGRDAQMIIKRTIDTVSRLETYLPENDIKAKNNIEKVVRKMRDFWNFNMHNLEENNFKEPSDEFWINLEKNFVDAALKNISSSTVSASTNNAFSSKYLNLKNFLKEAGKELGKEARKDENDKNVYDASNSVEMNISVPLLKEIANVLLSLWSLFYNKKPEEGEGYFKTGKDYDVPIPMFLGIDD